MQILKLNLIEECVLEPWFTLQRTKDNVEATNTRVQPACLCLGSSSFTNGVTSGTGADLPAWKVGQQSVRHPDQEPKTLLRLQMTKIVWSQDELYPCTVSLLLDKRIKSLSCVVAKTKKGSVSCKERFGQRRSDVWIA